jgi:hypothetical protein
MPKTFKAFCPNCEAITKQKFIEAGGFILIGDKMIPVSLKYYLCLECGEDYEVPSANYDPLAEAYHKLAIMNKN